MRCLETAYETLLLAEPSPGVVVVTLNRPDRSNAMTDTMCGEMEHVALALDDEDDCRVVIVTGAGTTFCAGYDLDDAAELPKLGAMGMLDEQERAARALPAIRSMRVPVITAVEGAAAGGGLALPFASDIRLGSATVKFNAAFVRIGLSAVDVGTSWVLTRLVGPAAASEICLTGRIVHADEAARIGLVNHISEGSALDEAVTLAESIVANSPSGVQLSKRALQANMEVSSYTAALELENRGTDMPEALAALKEKRAPVFTGQ